MSVGMSMRRGSAKLKTLGRSHGPLHMLLWQAREAQTSLLAAAAAQKTLFSDIATWASSENRALNDVCSCASELSSLYSGAMTQLALAFKSFRKEMSLVLEGEKRCDLAQKRLQDAEQKRIKLRRQVLRTQNRSLTEGSRMAGDFTQLQTQLAEAERATERAHIEACEASREQEAVKLVVMRTAMTKLSQSHLSLASNTKVIFEGNCEVTNLLPEPPPPGDPLSCIRYTSYDATKAIVERVKRQVNIENSSRLSISSSRPVSTSTPVTSPNSSSSWLQEPSAPGEVYPPTEPPPPYNTSYLSSSPNVRRYNRSSRTSSDFQRSSNSPRRCLHVSSMNASSISPNSSLCSSQQSFASLAATQSYHSATVENRSYQNISSGIGDPNRDIIRNESHSYANLPTYHQSNNSQSGQ